MSILGTVIIWITEFIEMIGYPGIFVLMMLESAGIPIPSEAVVTFAGFLASQGKMDFWLVVIYSSISNLVGSIIFYYIGYYLGRPFIENYGRYIWLDRRHLELAEEWFSKYGNIAVFIGRVMPAVRTYISFPAGLAKMPLLPFTILTIIGAFIWNFMLAYIGVILGENWYIIVDYLDIIGIIAIIIVILLVYKYIRKV
jgi:membrane protein DedA with SNARE-associated domain